ncbi:hypothetical protein [Stutzerimonas stutzeri]|uniref:hypothetical protein n=1 Tax=Stutzerimonas stutzeri TaxID=316 RepID=UPI0005EB7B92|nr:hypothetical protein [Stutzerimonas stutzeri]
MHHLTTLNLPTAPGREAERRALLIQVGAFLAGGGKINILDHTERAPQNVSCWNTSITRQNKARREFEQRQAELAGRIADLAVFQTELGPVRRTSYEVYKALKGQGVQLNTVVVEQLAAKFGIELREYGRCRA